MVMKVKEITSSTYDRVAKKQASIKNEEAGVGIITKQNTTKDVNKGTLRKMLKAFRLI
jgi:hypothetical protein